MTFNSPYARALEETDISAQFEGFEIEFNDKVTLFPVQVERRTGSHSRSQDGRLQSSRLQGGRTQEFSAANMRSIAPRKPAY